MGIQINGNTNNINAGIGSLSIEDINELDIVGVATAANFKTGVSNLHNLGLTLSGGQLDVGSNIKLGNAGVITATSFSGDGSNLTGITGTTINNNADNRVITGSGTANTLEGESLLTFDGNVLLVASNSYNILEMRADENNDGGNDDNILKFTHDGTFRSEMRYDQSSSTLELSTSDNRGDLVIDSSEDVMIGTNSAGLATGDEFTIHTTESTGMTIRSGTSGEGNIFFGDSDYGEATGIVRYDHSQNAMIFKTNSQGTDKLRINSNGDLTTTGSASFVRSNAGFTARAGDSVNIARASGTPLEISRTGNDGQMINFFRDTTGVAAISWNGSYLTLGTWSDTDVLKIGSTVDVTKKLKVDFTVSGSDYVALFRNNNANCYGVSIQQPSSANAGYPLLACTNSSGGSHFRVDSGGLVYANSGAGTDKKAYFVRAWVNFDGQGGSAGQNRTISDSQNISSVYDNDAGDFTINFATNMPTSAYAICGMASNWEATNADSYMITSAYKNVTYVGSCRIRTIRARFDQHPPQFRDSNETMIAIIC